MRSSHGELTLVTNAGDWLAVLATRIGDSSLLLVAACAAVLSASLPVGADVGQQVRTTVGSIVNRMQERYQSTSDFTADVRQEMTIASLGKTLAVRGTVSFKRPGKLRWEPRNAEGQVIVADGSTLWLYQPEDRQVLKTPFESAFRASTPISFLLGVGRIADEFEISLDPDDSGEIDASSLELAWLKLIPRSSDSTLGWLRLGVDTTTADVTEAEIHDQLGNVTRLRFTNFRRGVGLDDTLFRFEVPDGVDVVEAPIGF